MVKKNTLFFAVFVFLFIIIINLADSTCGTACPASRDQIGSCGYVSSSYNCGSNEVIQLTSDLKKSTTPCSNCIIVDPSSSNIIINGNGHTIDCGGSGKGIFVPYSSSTIVNVSVINTIFKNCSVGISIYENRSDIRFFKNNTFIYNGYGIVIGQTGGANYKNAIIEGNTFNYSNGILMYPSINANIRYNRFSQNLTDAIGIQLINPINATVEKNNFSVSSNGSYAIKIMMNSNSSGNIIRNNNVSCGSKFLYDVYCINSTSISNNAINLTSSIGNTFTGTKILKCGNNLWPIVNQHFFCCPSNPNPCAGKQCGVFSNGCTDITCPPNTCLINQVCNATGMCENISQGGGISNVYCSGFKTSSECLNWESGPNKDQILSGIQEHSGIENRFCFDKSLTMRQEGSCETYIRCSCIWNNNGCQELTMRVASGLPGCLPTNICITNVTIQGSCADENSNEYTISWKSNWTATGTESPENNCTSGTKKISCFRASKFYFFDLENLIITGILICVIYFLIRKRK